jgi:hypothetical protein
MITLEVCNIIVTNTALCSSCIYLAHAVVALQLTLVCTAHEAKATPHYGRKKQTMPNQHVIMNHQHGVTWSMIYIVQSLPA